MISAIFAFFTGQWVLGCLVLAYSQMQLSEALIWRGIDTGDLSLNRQGTTYGKYLLPTHNLAIGLGIILALLSRHRRIQPRDWLPLVLGLAFYGIILIVYARSDTPDTTFPANYCPDSPRSCQNWGNRLQWPYPHGWYGASYALSLILLLFWYEGPRSSKTFLLATFSILFIGTYFLWPFALGSAWCFSTAFCAPVIVGINWWLTRGGK